MANWTQAQSKAIETKDKTLLISAAAGSGKTTVLIERIIRSLTDPDSPADISRMLIVTFTRAAASELRQRISTALSAAIAERPGDKRLFRQFTSLGSAHISTIDSFYADVVRRNAQRLNISPTVRIADDSELVPLRKAIMDKVIEEGFSGELGYSGNDFSALTETLSDMRNDSSLSDVFTALYDKLTSHPHFIEFLRESAEFYDKATDLDFFDSPIGAVLRDHIASQLEYCEAIMRSVCEFFSSGAFASGVHLPPFVYDLEFCREARATVLGGGFDASRDIFASYAPMKRKPLKADEKGGDTDYYVSLRDDVKDTVGKLKKAYFSGASSNAEMKLYASETARRIKVLYALMKRFDSCYSEEKSQKGICEFNDIKLWAYRLLVRDDGTPSDLAADIAEGFDAVYIDEYQDVDLIQDLIFRAISRPRTRFMVGDIKQSIYGFRGAEPSLFMNYRENFPTIETAPDADECTIFMSENFRCDKSVIDFANLVCSHIFTVGGKEISYTGGDDLRFSKLVPSGYDGTPARVVLIDSKKPSEDEEPLPNDRDPESEYIAGEILRLTDIETKANGEAIKFSDIAVLYRSSTFGAKVAEALDRYGIPHTFGGSENIFDCPEVSLTFSLLNVIDNPRRDVHLAAALMSPAFGLDAQSLIDIREACNGEGAHDLFDSLCMYAEIGEGELSQRCGEIVSEINELRDMSTSLPSDKIIRLIYSSYSLLSHGGERSKNALTKFYENARSYEGDTFKGLYSYVKYIDDIRASGKTIVSETSGGTNSVNLMTMHKSKGLEFPVCFVGGCAGQFNRDDAKDPLLYSRALGIAMDLGDESGFGRIRTPFRLALSREIYDRSSEEEMRVFYVALTRARERLYVTAASRFGFEKELRNARTRRTVGTRASVLDSNNYIGWVLNAIHGISSPCLSLESYTAREILEQEARPIISRAVTDESSHTISEADIIKAEKEIESIFTYRYPYLHVSNVPAKLSVSKLSPNVLDRSEDIPENADSDTIDTKLPELISTPSFLEENDRISAAQRGTDTHTFLQFCDFGKVASYGVKKELERLIRDGFVEKRTSKTVNIPQIEAFFRSRLFDEIRKARFLRREQRFNILLPASEFTEDREYAHRLGDETLLVQGVIDLVFETEDGRLILCDYKTDHLSPLEIKTKALAEEKLTRAHRRQLSYYAAAVKRLFGRTPDLVLIYSLALGDTVVILPENID